jgi:hypothetical protein
MSCFIMSDSNNELASNFVDVNTIVYPIPPYITSISANADNRLWYGQLIAR